MFANHRGRRPDSDTAYRTILAFHAIEAHILDRITATANSYLTGVCLMP